MAMKLVIYTCWHWFGLVLLGAVVFTLALALKQDIIVTTLIITSFHSALNHLAFSLTFFKHHFLHHHVLRILQHFFSKV